MKRSMVAIQAPAVHVTEAIPDNESSQRAASTSWMIRNTVSAGAIPPANPSAGRLWFNTAPGWNLLMFWDATRAKWLSADLFTDVFSKNSSNQGTGYLGFFSGEFSASLNGKLLTRAATIVEISTSTNLVQAMTVEIRARNVATGIIATLGEISQGSAEASKADTSANLDAPIDHTIAVYIASGTSLDYPVATVKYRWRW